MTRLAVLRHGPTAWTEAGRIQGRTDVPLSEAGRARVVGWRLPPEIEGWPRVSSPLGRCLETARLVPGLPAGGAIRVAEPLIEMAWGEWEGFRLDELRRIHGTAMRANEDLGLDFRPPGGESPRDVQERLRPWLRALAREGPDWVVICHQGVIRALYALASGWGMVGRPAQKLKDEMLHRFALDPQGLPVIERLNIPLTVPVGSRP